MNCSTNSTDTDFNLELFLNTITSSNDITSYTIDWGDGSDPLNLTEFPGIGYVTHTYATGIFSLVISVTNSNGCTNEVSYDISNGSNPGGAFESAGSTTGLCYPTDILTFKIGGLWGLNPINTTYSVDFGDGNAQSFTQQDLEDSPYFNSADPAASAGFEVYHSYTTGSCSKENGEFIASLTITNDCGDTQWTIDSINVLEPSQPLFELESEIGCVNVPIQFDNQSIIGTNGDCDRSARFMWDFGDGSPVVNTPPGSDPVDWSHTYTEPGNYTITLSVFGLCGTQTYQQQICIEPEMLASFEVDTLAGCAPLSVSAQNVIDESELCSDPSYKWTVDYIAANCETSGDWEFINGTDETSENPEFYFKNPGKYKLTQNIITNCKTTPVEKIIEVKKPPEASIEIIDDFCGTALMNPVGNVNQCTENTDEVSYNWTFVGGIPATSNAVNPGDIAYDTPGVYEVTLQVSNSCGVSNIARQTFEIFEEPEVTNTAVTQEICSGQSTTEIVLASSMPNTSFAWTATASDGISGFMTSGEGTSIPSQLLMSTRDTPGTVVYAVTPKTNECDGFTKEFTVTVNPTPLFTSQPEGSEVCLNGTPNTLEATFTNETGAPSYQWYVNTIESKIGGDLITGASTSSYDPPASLVGDWYYYVVISFDAGGCNEISSEIAKVSVQPQVSIENVPSSQTICLGGSVSPLTVSYTGGTGTPSYQWYANTTNSNVGGTSITGATNASYTPTGFDSVEDLYYYVTISLDGDGCNAVTSDVYTISVVPKPSIVTQPLVSQELCQGAVAADLSIVATGGASAAFTYQWFQNSSNSIVGGTPIDGANTPTYTPNTSNIGTFYYYVVALQDASACSVVSAISELIVKPTPVVTQQPESSEVCLNGTPTTLEVAYDNGTGVPSYQWYVNTTDSAVGATPISGATASSYSPIADTQGDFFYYVVISFDSGGCNDISSDSAMVRVQPQLTIDAAPSDQIICVGGEVAPLEVTYTGGTGSPSYQWFSNTVNSNTGGTSIAGATSASYTPTDFTSVENLYYYVTIALDGDGCNTITSDVYSVSVTLPPSITAQPIGVQELCQGSVAADLSVAATGGTSATYAYQWFQNTSNNTETGVAISGATASTYTPNTSSVGTSYYYVVVSQPESACTVVSEVSQLIVKSAPVITKQPESSEVCLNGTPTILEVAYVNGTGVPSYQWYVNTTDSAVGAVPISGATASSFSPIADALGDFFYYVVISFSAGGCNEISSDSAKVGVQPQLTIDTTASDQIICVGGEVSPLEASYTGGTGNPSYQWYSNTSNSNTGGTIITGATSASYTPTNFTSVDELYYYVTISLDGDNCNTGTSDVYTITVTSPPSITAQPLGAQELCKGAVAADLSIAVTGGTTATYAYQWFQNTSNNTTTGVAITGATAATFTPNTNSVGTFYYYAVVSQPESACAVVSEVSQLIVKSAPVITKQPESSEVCLNEPPTTLEVTYANGTGVPSYQWYVNTTNSAVGANPITGATTSSYVPAVDTVGELFYYVVISFDSGGCAEIISDFARVKVNQFPVVAAASITINSGATFDFDPSSILGNTVPSNTSYTWSTPMISPSNSLLGGSSMSIPQNTISQTLENTGTTTAVAVYTVTPTNLNCIGADFQLEVIVKATINPNAVVIDANCFESGDGQISTNITGGTPFDTGVPYLIRWTGPNGFASTDPNLSNLAVGRYTLTIEDKDGTIFTSSYTIAQPPLLKINTGLEKNITCFQGNDGAIEVTMEGGTFPYTYNWTTLDGNGLIPGEKNQNNLTAGTYKLEVVDQNNCVVSQEYTLSAPDALTVQVLNVQDVLCFGDATGSITVDVFGGNMGYTYRWTGPNSFSSDAKNIDNLFFGAYELTVTDALGCSTMTAVSILQAPELEVAVTKSDVTCNGGADGSMQVVVSGGEAPYEIAWSNFANGFSQNDVAAGTYSATITDANRCEVKAEIVIEEPNFSIETQVTPISCNGANDASIDIQLTGGVAPISVIWSDNASAGLQRNNLEAGTYNVLIKDSDVQQCPIERTFVIVDAPILDVSSVVVDAIDCDLPNSGSIDLTVAGGAAPYKFAWSNGSTDEDLLNISQGEYAVEIVDANGCSVSKQFSIFRQAPLTITFEEETLTNCDINTIEKKVVPTVTGGFLPYTYEWSAGTTSGDENEILTADQSGSYVLTVTDDKGCTESKVFITEVPEIGTAAFDYTAFSLSNIGSLSIQDPIQFNNISTGDYVSLTWDFGDGTVVENDENPVHTYNEVGSFPVVLAVKYAEGCIKTYEILLDVTTGFVVIAPTGFTPNGDGYNERMRPACKGFKHVKMYIYDTWGAQVYFEEGSELNGWNGMIGNRPAENGNYVMVVKGITFYDREVTNSSPITLLK